MCKVAQVSFHSAKGSAGQRSDGFMAAPPRKCLSGEENGSAGELAWFFVGLQGLTATRVTRNPELARQSDSSQQTNQLEW
jgi:hypothetical protein